MNTTSRREFLHNGLSFLSLGMAAPALLARAAAETASQKPGKPASGKILVVLQLSGGNDGLNTVVPYTDDLYFKARPTLALAHNEVVPLSEKIGLHPSMRSLKPLYEQGHLAVIQGAGYPNPNRSHFRSMEIWQTAEPDNPPDEGWLGRCFDAQGHLKSNPLEGINFGGELPLTLHSDYGSVVSLQTPESYQLQAVSAQEHAAEIKAFLELYSEGTQASSYSDLIRKVGKGAFTSSEKIKKALGVKGNEEGEGGGASGQSLEVATPAVNGRATQLHNNLQTIAQLIGADLGTRVYYISTGGFDTHANQPTSHANLLKDVADSLTAFYASLEKSGQSKNVVSMVFSEFGRRVQENASSGTDHGAAGPMFVVGGAIKGGLYGQYPSLEDLYQGDLKHNVDFRQVYATLLDKWLETPAEKILKGHFEPLPFL